MKGLWLLVLLCPLLFASCSTYTKKECVEMNWFEGGKKFALSGQSKSQANVHFTQACQQEKGVAIDMTQLDSGFEAGLVEFCQPEKARQFGSSGGVYRGTCDNHTKAKEFLALYNEGRISFLEKEVLALQSEVSSLRSQIEQLQGKLWQKEEELRTSTRPQS